MADNLKKINLFETNQAFLNHIPENNEINLVNMDNDQTFKDKMMLLTGNNVANTISVTMTTNTYTVPMDGYIVVETENTNTNGYVNIDNRPAVARFGKWSDIGQLYSANRVSKGQEITCTFLQGTTAVLWFSPCYGAS